MRYIERMALVKKVPELERIAKRLRKDFRRRGVVDVALSRRTGSQGQPLVVLGVTFEAPPSGDSPRFTELNRIGAEMREALRASGIEDEVLPAISTASSPTTRAKRAS